MKKMIKGLIVLAMVAALILTGCSSKSTKTDDKTGDDKTGNSEAEFKNIMFVVTGTLGGRTNNDDVYKPLRNMWQVWAVK